MTDEPRADPARRPFAFFTLVFPLSIPFWLVGQAAPREPMPGRPGAARRLRPPAWIAWWRVGTVASRVLVLLAATFVTIVWTPRTLRR